MSILEEKPIRKWLKERRTIIPRKKLVDILALNPPFFSPRPQIIDKRFEELREKKRAEWRAKKYTDKLIERAFEWAQWWTLGIAEKIPDGPVREEIITRLYPVALEHAETWMKELKEALFES